jgi:hypothetical protein
MEFGIRIGEVMGHAGTDPKIFERVVQFKSGMRYPFQYTRNKMDIY